MTSHGWYRLAPFRWDEKRRVLHRVEEEGPLEISMKRGKLHVGRASARQGGVGLKPDLHARITRMFQLDVDVADFHAIARKSPAHAWVEEEGFGRLLCGATLWEDAVKIIATTNVMWGQTVRMIDRLVAKCGRGGAFPSQEDVLRFTPEELQRDCSLGYRAKSIHALAQRDLTNVPDEDRYQFYLSLPGIGPYGAAHLLAMDGRHDFIAVDTEFRRFVREAYYRGRRNVSDAAMLRRYAKWGRWKYLAYWSELHRGVAEALQPGASEDK